MTMTSRSISILLPGGVKGKPRPRFTKGGHAYTPESYKGYEERIASEYARKGGRSFGSSPVRVRIAVYRHLPKSAKPGHDTLKPDIDNILKAVLDALTGVAYDDDRQVVEVEICKKPRGYIDGADDMILLEVEDASPI